MAALALTVLAACGGADPAPSAPTTSRSAAPLIAPESHPPPEPAAAPEPAVPFAEVRTRSTCAFESLESLCAGLREHHGASDEAWTSDGCALGTPQTSEGRFAEARLIAIHSGSGRPGDGAPVERPLLGATVRDPVAGDVTANVLLVARIGEAWFPIHMFDPVRAADVEPSRLTWHLDEDGASLEWTDEPLAASREDPYGYGRAERTIAVADRGVPVIAAQATVEIWRSDVDLTCSRACNAEPSPPAYPGCERRCTSRARATRSWERVGGEIRIGATAIERTGQRADAIELEAEEARTVRLADASPDMRFCAFLPVEHAVPRTAARADPESTALLARAHALLARGGGRLLPGALAVANPDAPRSVVAIDAQAGTACGGGGCTTALEHRTLEGPFPEQGVHYFALERGTQTGCDPATLPGGAAPSLVVVAPVVSQGAIGCGFGGWDGTAERRWVIVQILE